MKTFITVLAAAFFSVLAWSAQAVDVNTASAEEIAEALKGVGLSKAESIVSYRQQNGPFKHIDELVNVKGIGIHTVDANRDHIELKRANTAKSGK